MIKQKPLRITQLKSKMIVQMQVKKGNVQTIEQSSANSNESDIPEQVDVTKDTTEQA